MNVRVVQPNIGQEDKWRPGYRRRGRAPAGGAVRARRPTSRGCCCGPRRRSPRRCRIAAPAASRRDRGRAGPRAAAMLGPDDRLLTGGLAVNSADGTRVDGATNSVFVLGPGGAVLGRYDKAHLVPYGEYLPMRPLLSAIGLSRLAPGDIDFAAGPGPRTIDARRAMGQGRLPALLRDHLLGPGGRSAPTARRSSSTRRTTPGSAAGARRSISPRRGSAPPRKACR